mgnify:CR=1 FL=1
MTDFGSERFNNKEFSDRLKELRLNRQIEIAKSDYSALITFGDTFHRFKLAWKDLLRLNILSNLEQKKFTELVHSFDIERERFLRESEDVEFKKYSEEEINSINKSLKSLMDFMHANNAYFQQKIQEFLKIRNMQVQKGSQRIKETFDSFANDCKKEAGDWNTKRKKYEKNIKNILT